MLRLVLFGGLRLEEADGPVTGRASQKRRLALLALLAVPPGHLLTRDKLIGFLWPEGGDERARRSLSTGLWDLRQELGEEVIETPGDSVGLNPSLISSDAGEFTEAIEAGDLERAVALYGGPFLDGVHVGASAEFERWADAERQRYAWKYREALEQLATRRQSDGDVRGAAEAWRLLAIEDPCTARVALGYMTALDAAGDRARALQFFRVHSALLRDDLETEPHPEVVELAERLREEPARLESPPEQPAPEVEVIQQTAPDDPARDGARQSAVRPPAAAGFARRARPWILAVVVLGLLGTGLVTVMMQGDDAAVTGPIRMAVLPFENRSAEPGTGYFVDGLSEEILNALAKVDGFRVPGWTSSSMFKGRALDAREVARQLEVRYVVGGNVQWEDERLRATVWLEDGRTGDQVWSESYDRGKESVFEVQEEIARSVVEILRPRLAEAVRPPAVASSPLVQTTTRDPAAYNHYLKARARWYERTPEGMFQALEELKLAIDIDPGYARAYAGIADIYNVLGAYDYGVLPPHEAYPAARAAAERALELDPALAEAHAALGMTLFNYDWDWARAEEKLRTAINLNPGHATARHWYSLLLRATGRREEALAQVLTARELDPRSVVISSSLARHHYFDRDYERAIDEGHNALALDSTHVLAYLGLGMSVLQLGQHQEALTAYRTAERLLGGRWPRLLGLNAHARGMAGDTATARDLYERLRAAEATTYVPRHYLAIAAIGLGLDDEAIDWLQAALNERSAALIYMHLDPIVDPIRAHPRFQALVRRAERDGLHVIPATARPPVQVRSPGSPG